MSNPYLASNQYLLPHVLIIADEVTGAGVEAILGNRYATRFASYDAGFDRAKEWTPDVIIFRENARDIVPFFEVLERFKVHLPRTKTIVIGSFLGGILVDLIGAAGIMGYLYDGDSLQECLVQAVEDALEKKPYFSPTAYSEYLIMASNWISRPFHSYLDSEALKVLRLLAGGHSIVEIAAQMKSNRRRIYWVREKLRKRFQAETNEKMISIATSAGFVGSVIFA